MRVTDIGNLCFERPNYLSGKSAWAELIPFAFTLIEKLRPSVFVELGTHYGDSYCAFCQAIQKASVNCQAYAVDTWEGDEHAGFYGQDVLNLLRSQHDAHYSGFSRLLRQTFDDAATHFAPNSVDLLHIDGLHTYEAVKHDFLTWLPLLSDQAVVIFHDINVRERDFGVWKLFDELSEQYPTFRFDHSHGLGIAAIGTNVPEAIKFLFELSDIDTMRIKEFYASLGLSAVTEHRLNEALQIQNAAVAETQREIASVRGELVSGQQLYEERLATEKRQNEEQLVVENQRHEEQLRITQSTYDASSAKDTVIEHLHSKVAQLEHEVAVHKNEIHSILNTRTWRTAAVIHRQVRGVRKIRTAARRVLIAKDRVGGWANLLARVKGALKAGGLSSLKSAMMTHLSTPATEYVAPHDILSERAKLTFAEIEQRLSQRQSETFDFGIKISLLMPVYKVAEPLLVAAIESVLNQSYINWELCIADDGSGSASLTALLSRYAVQDDRVRIKTLESNAGIAAATNEALALATGEYIALLDNDDVLTFDALYYVAQAINVNSSLDWIYSDECKIDESGKVLEIFTKPDWSPNLLLNCMYTGHLTTYRKSLVKELGELRSEFDFSQDYDLALRMSEKTKNVHHIERVLYGWRAIESSGAAGGKPYARDSNIRALQAAGDRRGWKGQAIALPTANRFKFDISHTSSMVSIVIPSDNAKNITESINSVCKNTSWKNYEILVVTNSRIVDSLESEYLQGVVKFIRYDLPYSFSDKCNKGAEASDGEYIVFFNDDVRVQSIDWVESIVEFLQLPEVGIVGPKLVYESNTIQHAGMVTGVRRLLGTAFHSLPEDTAAHYNFAQSVREVSLICGACLGIRKTVFDEIGGFDAVNTPINHSDVDLCFKVREHGYSCVYTPHSTLTHIGHMSLATVDAAEKVNAPKKKDKADVYILRRWPGYLAQDPFYTKAMRQQLFHDSPEYFELFAPEVMSVRDGKDILLYSHDLTESGAPRIVFELAKILTNAGHFVVVASPSDGPIREILVALGVVVIIDKLLLTQHPTVYDFAKNFDTLICNTVLTYPVVNQMAATVDTYWYIHETSLFTDLVSSRPDFVAALKMPKQIWAGSKLAAGPIKAHTPEVEVLEYGLPALQGNSDLDPLSAASDKLIIRTFGSYEKRKGQDLLAAAVMGLPPAIAVQCQFEFYGRVLDEVFFDNLSKISNGNPEIKLHGDVEYDEYVNLVLSADLVVVPSRDDTLPLVSLHALSAAKPLMCTNTTGTSAYLNPMKSGFTFPSLRPSEMTDELIKVIELSSEWQAVGHAGRAVFDRYFSEDTFAERLLSQLDFK